MMLSKSKRRFLAEDKVEEMCQEFILSDVQMERVMSAFLHDVNLGLSKDTHSKATVRSSVTYVQDIPSGNEYGKFLALDFGDINFRVVLVHLNDRRFDMMAKVYAVPHSVASSTGKELFDHVAGCIANFLKEFDLSSEELSMGFTFNFPISQRSLTVGILERWVKSFNCTGTVGMNVVELLEHAIAKRKIPVKIEAILDSTTGQLLVCAWQYPETKMSVVMGVGTNICYVEKVINAETFHGDSPKPYVVINTGCNMFGDNGTLDFLRTLVDREVDNNSYNPGKQILEKLISGVYMGEIVRLMIIEAINNMSLFKGKKIEGLSRRGSFFMKYVSEIESDRYGDFTYTKAVLKELQVLQPSEQDMVNIKRLCQVVTQRGIDIMAALIATLLNKMGFPLVTISIDGSLYRFHPGVHNALTVKIKSLLKKEIEFNFVLTEEGGGVGAAMLAATLAYERQDRRPSYLESKPRVSGLSDLDSSLHLGNAKYRRRSIKKSSDDEETCLSEDSTQASLAERSFYKTTKS